MYLGNQPALNYTSFAKQDFTTSATTSYTLDHPVTNENEIALFINFVRQEPGTAYTASNTNLNLTSATSASDDMYCIFLGKAVQTVNPPSGSVGSSQVASTIITGQTAETSVATDDLILLSDTSASGALKKMTRANFVSGIGGTNTPAFFVTLSSSQTLNSGASTKLNFDSEVYDTNSAYDNSTNYRFTVPSGQAGKYYIGLNIQFYDQQSRMNRMISEIHLNGTKVRENDDYGIQDKVFGNSTCDTFFDLSVGDYLEAYAYGETGDGGTFAVNGGTSNLRSFFGGYKLIE